MEWPIPCFHGLVFSISLDCFMVEDILHHDSIFRWNFVVHGVVHSPPQLRSSGVRLFAVAADQRPLNAWYSRLCRACRGGFGAWWWPFSTHNGLFSGVRLRRGCNQRSPELWLMSIPGLATSLGAWWWPFFAAFEGMATSMPPGVRHGRGWVSAPPVRWNLVAVSFWV